jgi:hypothetical protein
MRLNFFELFFLIQSQFKKLVIFVLLIKTKNNGKSNYLKSRQKNSEL